MSSSDSSRMSGIKRFLSRKDKRSSTDQQKKPRLVTADDLYGLFVTDESRKPGKAEEKKIVALQSRLAVTGIINIKDEQIDYALRGRYADGDADRAYELLVLLQRSVDGKIDGFNPNIKLLGAVNRFSVTCWLDALLFAMFARLRSFEAILYGSFNDEPRKRLVILLRLWVNMLRGGKLITTDITKAVQEALAACGWPEAAEIHQQDVSEAFAFITEQLELPRLSLKMDIYHTGKEDAKDDHKIINERLLQVGIPSESPEGKVITLEDCLESYFNNRIEVRRHLERRGTLRSMKSFESDSVKGHTFHVETRSEGRASPVESDPQVHSLLGSAAGSLPALGSRNRSSSIIRERVVSDEAEASGTAQNGHPGPLRTTRKKSLIRKEVLMPAWQFFSLIPWYTDRAVTNDAQVAAHFSSERPVLGLCLKRYSMLPNGKAVRLNTYVDIPVEIGLPHFIQDDDDESDSPQFGNFKLSLQSVVCHRGSSVDAGHYVALVRCLAQDTTGSGGRNVSGRNSSGPNESEQDRWIRFDDLATERVSYVDIDLAMKEESPYLLFYQVQPLDKPHPSRIDVEPPPPYSESTSSEAQVSRVSTAPEDSTVTTDTPGRSQRTSLDLSLSVIPRGRISTSSERHTSLVSPTADGESSGPAKENGKESSWAAQLSSRISRADSKSQPTTTTQTEEGRLSATFSRLTARMSRDKLQNGEAKTTGTAEQRTVFTAELQSPVGTNKKREKSRNRLDGSAAQSGPAQEGRTPDRECVLM